MITEPAPAKINLALHVRACRADGYHEIETLFAFLLGGDAIRVARGPAGLVVDGPFAAGLDGEGDNLVTRATRRFAEAFGGGADYAIALTKNLPVASGIGGGSADAAATLRALARLNGVPADHPQLRACAEALGSDVPACLLGRTALGRGRGERLDALDGLAGTPVLLVNPGVAVPTGRVFGGWDGIDRGGIGEGAPLDIALAGRNDLEPAARAIAPVIDEVLRRLGETRPILARMSGSGATCFALYESTDARGEAARRIRAVDPDWWCLESALA